MLTAPKKEGETVFPKKKVSWEGWGRKICGFAFEETYPRILERGLTSSPQNEDQRKRVAKHVGEQSTGAEIGYPKKSEKQTAQAAKRTKTRFMDTRTKTCRFFLV